MGAVSVLEEVGPPPTRLPRGAYYALTVLTALNVINLWHRYLMVSSVTLPWSNVTLLFRSRQQSTSYKRWRPKHHSLILAR